MALLRFGVASVTIGIYAVLSRRRIRWPQRHEWPALLACGFLGVALYHPLLNYGEKVVSAGAASLLINSSPVWTALLAIPVLGERLTGRKVLGIAVGFAGIALIVLGKRDAQGQFLRLEPASLAIIGSAICAAGYVLIQKKFLSGYTALEFTCWNIWAGTLLLAPFFGWPLVVEVMRVPVARSLEVVYLGIFPGALAYMAFAYATQRLPAARVMSFLYLVPPVAILLAWLYLHELPNVLSLAGGALAIGGVALVNTGGGPRRRAETLVAVEEA